MKITMERIFSYVLSAGLGLTVLVLGLSYIYLRPGVVPQVIAKEEWPAPFSVPADKITARAAVVYDPVTNRILYAKNAKESLPLASLTKLVSAQAVLAQEDVATPVPITESSIAPEGDWGFWVGEQWATGDLIRFALAASSNDAIAAAAASLGPHSIDLINQEAHELGAKDVRILNPTGLDEASNTAGAYGSAYDVALLAGAFLADHPTFFEATAVPSVTIAQDGHILTATSTAVPLLDMPGLIGAKTGFTDLAGGNLVAAFDLELGHPIIIAVLGSTREGRFADVKLLLEEARKQIL